MSGIRRALIVLVVFGLWTARSHLKDVLRKAWNSDAPVDDSREIMSYRTAVLCFLGGAANKSYRRFLDGASE